jgi:hypothetical protein
MFGKCPTCGNSYTLLEFLGNSPQPCNDCDRKEAKKPRYTPDTTQVPEQKLSANPSIPATQIANSGVAILLAVFAWIELILSPIVGLIIGSQDSTFLGWMIFVTGFVSGLILLGFSRVVKYLCESSQYLRRIDKSIQAASEKNALQ